MSIKVSEYLMIPTVIIISIINRPEYIRKEEQEKERVDQKSEHHSCKLPQPRRGAEGEAELTSHRNSPLSADVILHASRVMNAFLCRTKPVAPMCPLLFHSSTKIHPDTNQPLKSPTPPSLEVKNKKN